MLEELIQPFVADGVEEATYVSVQQPIHLLFRETNPKCVECIVAPASGPMPVAETEEVRLVDAFEHRLHGLLHDFVLQGCYAQGTLPSIRFGNPGPFGRLCPIRAAVNTAVKIGEPIFQPIRVVSPRHVVDAGSRLTVEVQETRLEQFGREVVEQCGEPHPFVPRPSDSPAACALGGWSVTFPNRPASPIGEGTAWVSRFPCCEFPRMRRFSDSAASRQGLPKRPAACGLPLVRTRSAHGTDDFGAQWLACVYPCPCHTRDVAITSVGLGAEANG